MKPLDIRGKVAAAEAAAAAAASDGDKQDNNDENRLYKLANERAALELKQLQVDCGLLAPQSALIAAEGLEWLYENPLTSNSNVATKQEEYLLGKPIEGSDGTMRQLSKSRAEVVAAGGSDEGNMSKNVSLSSSSFLTTNIDNLRKLREDPLFLIKQAEYMQQKRMEKMMIQEQRVQKITDQSSTKTQQRNVIERRRDKHDYPLPRKRDGLNDADHKKEKKISRYHDRTRSRSMERGNSGSQSIHRRDYDSTRRGKYDSISPGRKQFRRSRSRDRICGAELKKAKMNSLGKNEKRRSSSITKREHGLQSDPKRERDPNYSDSNRNGRTKLRLEGNSKDGKDWDHNSRDRTRCDRNNLNSNSNFKNTCNSRSNSRDRNIKMNANAKKTGDENYFIGRSRNSPEVVKSRRSRSRERRPWEYKAKRSMHDIKQEVDRDKSAASAVGNTRMSTSDEKSNEGDGILHVRVKREITDNADTGSLEVKIEMMRKEGERHEKEREQRLAIVAAKENFIQSLEENSRNRKEPSYLSKVNRDISTNISMEDRVNRLKAKHTRKVCDDDLFEDKK